MIEELNDDTLATMRANSTAADLRRKPWQKALQPGDCVLRHMPEYDLFVYIEILDPLAGSTDCDEHEYLRAMYAEPHMEGYRFARHYSSVESDGELGDLHVSAATHPLTLAQFERARAEGWPSEEDAVRAILMIT